MKITRREALLRGLFGAGLLGLRALATGVPAAVLLRPLSVRADDAACFAKDRAQYLLLSTSANGDPINANAPGSYDYPDIPHSADPQMAKTPLVLAGKTYQAARPWSTLPQAVLDRTCFFHHATLTNSHANQSKVMKLMGAVKRQEMLVSLIASQLSPCLGTIQPGPVSVGALGPGELLSYQGRIAPNLTPTGLRAALISPPGTLKNLQQLRDADLDRLNALYRQHGTNAQRDFLDRLALSQREARAISQQLLDNLSSINSDGPDGQVLAAVALIKMNVTPVVSLHIPFGGDNHTDLGLRTEAAQTVTGVATIASLLQQLQTYGLQDRVTFVAMNVFGRTLTGKGGQGRDHYASHHVSVIIGKGVRGGVIGGLVPKGGDYVARAIDSSTGLGSDSGDISFEDTLGAMGKTLGAAAGVDPAVLDDQITSGKIVRTALAAAG